LSIGGKHIRFRIRKETQIGTLYTRTSGKFIHASFAVLHFDDQLRNSCRYT